jgi:hypothetical protein
VVHAVHAMYAYRCISGMPGVLETSGIRIGDVLVSINSVPVHDIPTVQQVGYNIHYCIQMLCSWLCLMVVVLVLFLGLSFFWLQFEFLSVAFCAFLGVICS